MTGKKRASPGADVEKNPLQGVELGEEDANKLQGIQREIARAELIIEREAHHRLLPVYEKRRAVAKAIPKFWPVALMNHADIAYYVQHSSDQLALSYLEDLWIVRNAMESRCYTLEFYFKENNFFSDKILKKEYKRVLPPAAAGEEPDEDGITESMVDFSWERDVKISGSKIQWKDPSKALTTLHPREKADEEEEPAEPGSFFNFFEHADDPYRIGAMIASEIFPDAIEHFLGTAGDELDSEEEESDEDDEDEDEIDLEQPRTKRPKNA